jgi:hypothetical protein
MTSARVPSNTYRDCRETPARSPVCNPLSNSIKPSINQIAIGMGADHLIATQARERMRSDREINRKRGGVRWKREKVPEERRSGASSGSLEVITPRCPWPSFLLPRLFGQCPGRHPFGRLTPFAHRDVVLFAERDPSQDHLRGRIARGVQATLSEGMSWVLYTITTPNRSPGLTYIYIPPAEKRKE